MNSKKELRKQILQQRDALTPEERRIKSIEIAKRVILHPQFQEADQILLFASYKSEVDTTEIFRAARMAGKEVYYPKVLDDEMEFYLVQEESELLEGYKGIREPETASGNRFVVSKVVDIQQELHMQSGRQICMIMPGAVFDEMGNRIGYGGGYYDKFLRRLEDSLQKENALPENCLCKIALAFECQVTTVGEIQSEEHDVKPDYIVTEKRIISAEKIPFCVET